MLGLVFIPFLFEDVGGTGVCHAALKLKPAGSKQSHKLPFVFHRHFADIIAS